MAKIINQSSVDLSNSVLYSPSTGTPMYFFFGTLKAWRKNSGILKIVPGEKTTITLAPGSIAQVGMPVEILNVEGMLQINGLTTSVLEIVDENVVKVDIDSRNFSEYTGGGYASFIVDYADEIQTAELVRSKIIGMKRVTGEMMCHVVKRYDWQEGMTFVAYDPMINMMDRMFYTYANGNIYLCLDNAKGMSSTVRPSGMSKRPQKYVDGYTWQYVQKVSTQDMDKFGSEEWIPVRPHDEFNIVSGSIISVLVENRGKDYMHNDRVRIIGDGEGAEAQIGRFLTSGSVLNINVTRGGKGYTWADAWIEPADGSPARDAVIKPVISPSRGKFTNPVQGLLAHNIRFVFEIDGDEDGQLYTGPIRSIGMIRPQIELYQSEFSKEVIDTRSWIDVGTEGQIFEIGDELVGLISNTKATCAGSREDRIWYVEPRGPGFIEGEIITSGIKTAVSSKIHKYDMTLVSDSFIIYVDNFSEEYMRNKDQLDKFIVTISY